MARDRQTSELIVALLVQAREIADKGHAGWGNTMSDAADALFREMRRADWFRHRFDELQKAQQHMRDPERKMVCDILANCKTFETETTDNG